MTPNGRTIAVFGTSKAGDTDSVYQLAYQVGYGLAAAGFTIANGGYGGTMQASAQGAYAAGGRVIGVTCRAFRRGKANPYVTEEIPTDALEQRLAKLVELGDGYVVLPGGTGTLLELATIWEHKNKGFETAGKPILVFRPFWEPVITAMQEADSRSSGCIAVVDSPDQVVQSLFTAFQVNKK